MTLSEFDKDDNCSITHYGEEEDEDPGCCCACLNFTFCQLPWVCIAASIVSFSALAACLAHLSEIRFNLKTVELNSIPDKLYWGASVTMTASTIVNGILVFFGLLTTKSCLKCCGTKDCVDGCARFFTTTLCWILQVICFLLVTAAVVEFGVLCAGITFMATLQWVGLNVHPDADTMKQIDEIMDKIHHLFPAMFSKYKYSQVRNLINSNLSLLSTSFKDIGDIWWNATLAAFMFVLAQIVMMICARDNYFLAANAEVRKEKQIFEEVESAKYVGLI